MCPLLYTDVFMKYYLHQGGKGKMFFHQKPFRWPKTSRQVTTIPKPELRGFGGDSLTKPPFGVTSAEVVIICPENMAKQMFNLSLVLFVSPEAAEFTLDVSRYVGLQIKRNPVFPEVGYVKRKQLTWLVGGFNPIEKYQSTWVHLPQFSGWK